MTSEASQSSVAPDSQVHGQQPKYVVAVGASAGGLQALETLFRAMTPTSSMGFAFVVIQHLMPGAKSQMRELVSRWTTLAVVVAEQDMPLAADTVFLIPPGVELRVAEGLLTLEARAHGVPRPIDVFMRSCAAEFGDRSVAVVLSGTGDDGSRGVRAVHDAGGLVVVQREDTAEFVAMPHNAIVTGTADAVVPPQDIFEVLQRHVAGRLAVESQPVELVGMQAVFATLLSRYGIDFALYKPPTVKRRVERRINLGHHSNLDSYIERLRNDPAEIEELYRDLLIGVTGFFRDKEAFQALADEVISKIALNATEQVRVWVAGCATGEEAYSVAMLLTEACERCERAISVRVFATDVHQRSLQFASAGTYSADAVAEVGEARLARFFTIEGDCYRVTSELRRMVVFASHNLLRDAPFTKLDLISCRNLLIYLQDPAQRRVLSLFHFGLRTEGVLFMGSSGTPGDLAPEFEPINQRWRIYRKRRDVILPALAEAATSLGQTWVGLATARHDIRETYLQLFATMLEEALPPSVLVDQQHQIIHTFGDIAALLRFPRGWPSLNLLSLLAGDLKIAVAGALHRSASVQAAVSYPDVCGRTLDTQEKFDVRVRPLQLPENPAVFYLVSVAPAAIRDSVASPDVLLDYEQASGEHLEALEHQLRFAKENLQATVEALSAANEELQAANEELLASNEELHSTNEELQTVNAQLHTVNAELQGKINDLLELTDDMDNLLLSTEVHTLFLDADLAIRKFTPAIAEAFHLVNTDVGRRIEGFAYNLDFPDLVGLLARVRATGERYEGEVHSHGLTYLMRVVPYRGRGKTTGVVLTLVDITRLQQVETELREQVEQRDQFLAMLSHELRNPLGAIINALRIVERLMANPAPRRVTNALDLIFRQARHMQRLLDDLLDVARLTRGKIQLRKVILDLRPLLSEVLETSHATLDEHRPSVTIEQQGEEALWVYGDATRLVQIFDNLVFNAIKYTQEGGHVTIKVDRNDTQAVVRVQDDGIGMDAQTLAHVFDLFHQADTSLDRSRGGLGIGLTLVHKLVGLHGGTIEAHSKGVGFGSELVVRFPLESAPVLPATPTGAPVPRPKPRIVVVDDRPELRLTLVDLLTDSGFEVSAACDGLSGLRVILEEHPDAALLDIGLPGIDGYELARRLRSEPSTTALKLIAVTGYGGPENVIRATAAGFDGHLVKPVDIEDVIMMLARFGVSPS